MLVAKVTLKVHIYELYYSMEFDYKTIYSAFITEAKLNNNFSNKRLLDTYIKAGLNHKEAVECFSLELSEGDLLCFVVQKDNDFCYAVNEKYLQ